MEDGPTDEELLELSQLWDLPLHPAPALSPAHLPPAAPPAQVSSRAPALPPGGLDTDTAELLPESWRAALTAELQQWIGRVLFTRGSKGGPGSSRT